MRFSIEEGFVFERYAGVVMALTLIGLPAGQAQAQAAPEPAVASCFEVIPPQGRLRLAGPILLNRCNGDSWVLVRTYAGDDRLVYRWRPIAIERREAAFRPRSRPATEAPQVSRPSGSKCFIFDGRKFCE